MTGSPAFVLLYCNVVGAGAVKPCPNLTSAQAFTLLSLWPLLVPPSYFSCHVWMLQLEKEAAPSGVKGVLNIRSFSGLRPTGLVSL